MNRARCYIELADENQTPVGRTELVASDFVGTLAISLPEGCDGFLACWYRIIKVDEDVVTLGPWQELNEEEPDLTFVHLEAPPMLH